VLLTVPRHGAGSEKIGIVKSEAREKLRNSPLFSSMATPTPTVSARFGTSSGQSGRQVSCSTRIVLRASRRTGKLALLNKAAILSAHSRALPSRWHEKGNISSHGWLIGKSSASPQTRRLRKVRGKGLPPPKRLASGHDDHLRKLALTVSFLRPNTRPLPPPLP
jgi:hypothetical protein